MFKTKIKIIFTIITLTLFFLNNINSVVAFSPSTAKSMDNFKDEQYKNIFE
jgi:hypothetical protein